ncbi:DUF4097 family beta strand repeat-containing protein [Clostridium cellulovorans]|uniref:DUF4097 domain-containing protein n=1 Tax=Clostridium cellulovorans (strain ATCC 35296 / DSM 3052 / OCM 3 / 743B) TaxID=573061 RepID=D9SWZ5_CLOC7|nr:DUF4097 family beta strand repeat-containing protein [Clostridium cellulovorans]ADL51356.1 hypothetical protein Clocel_1609 [Clostridium cellulovorans 743B]
MNRTLKKILLVIWLSIAIVLTGFLIYAIKNDKGIGDMFIFNRLSLSGAKVQKEEKVPLDKYENIRVNFSSGNVIINATDDEELKVIQKSNKQLDEEQKFTISKSGNTIEINKGQKSIGIHFGTINERIEVYIPKKYEKNLKINCSSGDIEVETELKVQSLDVEQSSGDFISSNSILVDKISMETHSGDIEINDLVTGSYEFSSTSGDINIKSLAGTGNIEASSGDIHVIYNQIDEYADIKATSGDINIRVPKDLSFQFEGKCNSGDISSNLALDYKGKNENEATAKIGQEPYKKIIAKTSSGDINISQD